MVLPDCHALTDAPGRGASRATSTAAARVVVDRPVRRRTCRRRSERLLGHARRRRPDDLDELLPRGRQVDDDGVGGREHRSSWPTARYALHLVNYDYDAGADAVRRRDVERRRCGCRLPSGKRARPPLVTQRRPAHRLELRRDGAVHVVTRRRARASTSIVVFHDGRRHWHVRIAVAARAARRFEIEEVAVPPIRADEVLVRGGRLRGLRLRARDVGRRPATGRARATSGTRSAASSPRWAPRSTDLAVGDRVGVWVTERGFAEYVAVRADVLPPGR